MRTSNHLLVALFYLFIACPYLSAEENPPFKPQGFIDLNAYFYDTREQSTLTINLLSSLPYRFQYFSFVNYDSAFASGDPEEIESFYSEQQLAWHLPNSLPLQLVANWSITNGPDNDAIRFGPAWIVSSTRFFDQFFKMVNVFYMVRFYLLQIDSLDGFNWQMEHVYSTALFPNLLANRVYISGFADHNFLDDGSTTLVTETQLGIRIIDQFFAIAEYRHSDFTPDKDGVGFGVEYKIRF